MKTPLQSKETFQSEQRNISSSFLELKEKFGAAGLKLSTEDAGMSFEQITYWTQIVSSMVPVIVKIGGPEAKNDMKMLSAINNISGIIAPMVESPYSLQKYISSLKEIFGQNDQYSRHINIETITGCKNLSQILSIPEISFINEITIGRGDLSRSINKEVDDPEVSHLCETIVKAAREKNIKVSIGGAINPQNANRIFKEIGPDKINTRSVVFNKESSINIKQSVLKALEFEIIMMKENLRMGFVPANETEYRIEKLKERMHIA